MRDFRKTGLIVVLVALVVVMMTTGCGKRKEGAQNRPEVAVLVMRAESVPLATELPARISALLVAEVRPQVTGIIKKRLFTEGDDVKAGETLYQIDAAPYQAAFDNASASLTRAEANLPPLRSKARRYKELVAIRAVSQQDFEDVTAAYTQAEADVKYWKAAVETARINLGYTSVSAPISGRIGKSAVTVGALATANQASAFATIQKLDPVYVDATQSSANLLKLQRSMTAGRIKGSAPNQAKVRLLLEDGTLYPLEGTLKFSDVTVDPSTGSFILRMVFPNPKKTLLPGMYVRTVVQEGIAERAILAPQQGVARDPKGNPYVLLLNANDKVEQRMITVDRAIADRWLVSEGLKEGDRVIVEGLQKIRPGASVKAIPFRPGQKSNNQPGNTEDQKLTQPTKKAD
ncbi:MAG: Multidrug resistance protein MexA precursor [Syntrophorhabdus sp. PtaB.Bin047]|jgi:membrane fusion protein (multidrug efflux system)|nr:MAG: Multidrug resistance protein MexA precursor [Syntrophorhabdus sp. PtaB.Bin047]